MSTGTNKERITQNNGIISENNADLTALKTRINNLPTSGDTTATANDIAVGKTAVSKGVKLTGTLQPGIDTLDATATASDMAQGKTAYVNGQKITGNIEEVNDIIGTANNVREYVAGIAYTIPISKTVLMKKNNSYRAFAKERDVAYGIGLSVGKLKAGEYVCGIRGTFTSDATATASDIVKDKTAYVNGQKVTGTYEGSSGLDWSQIGYSGVPQEVTNGFNHAQSIMQNWTVKSDYSNECEEDIDLIFMPLVDTSSATTMQEMFLNCYSLITVPLLNTSNVTNMENMFCGCGALQSVPVFDTSNVTTMAYMFNNCTSLKTVPAFDTSNVTNMRAMFSGCDALQSIPILNFEQVENTSSMFAGCLSLTTIPDVDIEANNLTNTSGMFSGCKSLEIIPDHFDIPEAQDCSSMFANCTSLTTVPMFSLEGVNSMSNMFSNCPLLSEDSLDNILGMLGYATGEGYSGTKTLKWIGLSQSQASICETLRHWSNCQETGWETGY